MAPIEISVTVRIELSDAVQRFLADLLARPSAAVEAVAQAPAAGITFPAKPTPAPPAAISAPATPNPQPAPAAPASGKGRVWPDASNIWSPARIAVLKRDYPAGVATDKILAALNALPGGEIGRKAVAIAAARYGCRRPAPAAPTGPATTITLGELQRYARANRVPDTSGEIPAVLLARVNAFRGIGGCPPYRLAPLPAGFA